MTRPPPEIVTAAGHYMYDRTREAVRAAPGSC